MAPPDVEQIARDAVVTALQEWVRGLSNAALVTELNLLAEGNYSIRCAPIVVREAARRIIALGPT